MAPEVVRFLPYTEKVDMYSYGVMMWQVFTGFTPYRGMSQERFNRDVVFNGERPPLVDDEEELVPPEIANILQQSWAHDHFSRATATQIFDQMKAVLAGLGRSSWLSWFL